MEVKTLKPKEIKKAREFFNNLDDSVKDNLNNYEWIPVYDKLKPLLRGNGWAFNGCIWSTLYSIDNNIYEDMRIIPEGAFAYTNIEEIKLEDISIIKANAFYNSSISKITLSNKVQLIDDRAFLTNRSPIIHIRFNGTTKEFRNIRKGNDWYSDRYNNNRVAYVVCDDGDLEYGGI